MAQAEKVKMYLLIIQVHLAPVGGKYALKEIGSHSECITNLIMAMECNDHECICIHVQCHNYYILLYTYVATHSCYTHDNSYYNGQYVVIIIACIFTYSIAPLKKIIQLQQPMF